MYGWVCAGISRVTLDPASCLQVNVNRPVQRRLEESELRLVRIGCLIEMHYRSASPAGSEAAAIVHNPTAIGPQGEVGYSTARQGFLSVKTKDDNRSNAACFS